MELTSDIVPNWLIATPDPSVAVGHLCEPFKVEMGLFWEDAMKIRISPGSVSQPRPNRLITLMPQPAERLPKSKSKSVRRCPMSRWSMPKLVEEFAARVEGQNRQQGRGKAFLISLRQDFGQGSSTVDWADAG